MSAARRPIIAAVNRACGRAAVAGGVLLLLGACGGPPAGSPAASVAPAAATGSATGFANVARAETPASAPTGADLANLREELMALRGEVRDLRAQLNGLPGAHVATAAPPDARTDAVAREQAQDTERLRLAATESAFQGERVDPRWAPATTASVQASLAQAGGSLRNDVRSIECRTQSCRVEIDADAGAAMAQELPLFVSQLGQSLPRVTAGQVDQGDGRQATVLYMSR